MTDERKTGKRKQVYMAGRHIAWWERLPRYDRSRIIAEALDLWREKHEPTQKLNTPHQDAEK